MDVRVYHRVLEYCNSTTPR
ncbi:hypothetical protein E2C01_051855 [Portunus trituberculatus]|uniref:Uncharacterized protein n=1 Tax=Portunus trituberculatus TaxID=210409 RepID=A0A5B7GJZ3_PORTR|nr:hypothetical protein [Portunus trituberculatus]